MEVFGKGTPHGVRPMLAPGTCWICDMAPIQEEMKVIDTRRNARPGGPTSHASVRKYICESCALEMGGAMGMIGYATEADFRKTIDDLNQGNRHLMNELESARASQVRVVPADEIADVVSETVRAELAKTVKPAPKKRAASPVE